MTYDVAIIGSGTAGLTALQEVRKTTENFVIINDGPYGTTCARVGCMPSKALIEIANAFHRRKVFDDFGIRGSAGLSIDIPAVLRRVRSLRDDLVRGALQATNDLGERNIAGRAQFISPDRLEVNGRTIRAKKIIIATGSKPNLPEEWTKLGNRVLTSETLFEQKDLPSRIAVIGLGAVGVEFAQALARLGIQVTGFGRGKQIAGISDPDVNAAAILGLGAEFSLYTGVSVSIEARDDKIAVLGSDRDIVVAKVVAALGRIPNLSNLGLDRLGVPLDQKGRPPFNRQTMQIDDLPVFIAGDANGYAPLQHEGGDDGHIAGRNAMADAPGRYKRRTPIGIIFCDPNIISVGRRYETLKEGEAVIGKVDFSQQGRARLAARNQGIARIYADARSGQLLGAALYAPAGEHMAHLLALAIDQALGVQDLLRLPFYHPVLEEGLRTALRDAARQLPSASAFDLADCNPFNSEAVG